MEIQFEQVEHKDERDYRCLGADGCGATIFHEDRGRHAAWHNDLLVQLQEHEDETPE
jgi:hypothetical protein